MARLLLTIVAATVLLTSAAGASLCPKCRDSVNIMSVGECRECRQTTTSGAFAICPACSARLNQCEKCRAPLAAVTDAPRADAAEGGNRLVAPGQAPRKRPRPDQQGQGGLPGGAAGAGDAIRGTVADKSLQARAPGAGFLADAAALKALLQAWGGDVNWTTDFTKNIVLVATADGPNHVGASGRLDDKGNLEVVGMSTMMAGPGFGWGMAVHTRAGVRTVNGQALPPPASQPSAKARQRAAALTAAVARFTLDLQYFGDPGEPYASLSLRVADVREAPPAARLTPDQGRSIIDRLAVDGFLDSAINRVNVRMRRPQGPTYVLLVSGPAETEWYEELGWGRPMLARLDGLRAVLEGDAAKEMDLLLGRLSGHRKQWEREAAAAPKDASGGAAAAPAGGTRGHE